MFNNKKSTGSRNEEELREAIIRDKSKGVPDFEIGQKYGVSYKFIEKVITQSEGINISTLRMKKKIRRMAPKDQQLEETTVWSFKQRGDWATHSGEYRGNWSPFIPRNVILRYSRPGELVLDYFCGAGTTAVECKLLGRRCMALDINDKAIERAKENIDFDVKSTQLTLTGDETRYETYEPELWVGDARDLSFLQHESVDLICAHPPYADIIHYTDAKDGDLSFFSLDKFLGEMTKVAEESYRVLKPGRQCAILIGDMRKKKRVVPLGFSLINVYLNAGFKLKELVIKRQHNCKTTGFWYDKSLKYNFLLLAHEYLPIFEKPKANPIKNNEKGSETTVTHNFEYREKPRKEIEGAETTTVWVSNTAEFKNHIEANLVNRYCKDEEYLLVTLEQGNMKTPESIGNNISLLLLDFSSESLHESNFKNFLPKTLELVNQYLDRGNNERYVVFKVKDYRWHGYTEPLAKWIVDRVDFEDLKLKEIIVFSAEGNGKEKKQKDTDQLKITHEYGIVYEVSK